MEKLNEMEDMRRQMAALKSELDKQKIVNDRMIRRAMNNKSSWIRRRYIICMITAVAMVPYCYFWMVHILDLSISLWIFTSIFMLVVTAYTYRNMKALNRDFISEANLMEACQEVAKAMKMDADWLKIGIPFIIVWLSWITIEAYHFPDFKYFAAGVVAGAVFGGTAGLITHFKIQRKYKEIVEQME